MNRNLIKDTKNILSCRQIKPFKALGQNFLIDKTVLKKIIQSASLKLSDIVLEIGPGTGILTRELAKKAKKIIAVEKDKKMAEILKNNLNDFQNIKIINADILKLKNLKLPKDYKVAANLPYYIASPVIRKFLELKTPPKLMVLMVQKEVGQRICAKPPRMNLLAVSVQFYGKPEIIDYVPKKSFWPQPKIDSAIIKITPYNKYKKETDSKLFFRIVKAGFSQPRKQISNNLEAVLKLNKKEIMLWLSAQKIKPSQRAESLSVAEWRLLTKNLPIDAPM